MNYKIIRYILGWVLKIESVSMMLPFMCALVYSENKYLPMWAFCLILCSATGFLLSLSVPENKSMYAKEGFVTVALSWIVISIFGALPFIISGAVPDFMSAIFETASGFTTTGASVISDVEVLPKSLLFWRSFTHWIGGMGVLVFLVAIFPHNDGNNFYLIKAESPGPSVSKLVPKIKSTAKILYKIYIVLTAAEVIMLLAGGMDFFTSVTLSFGTAGTGGFSILNSSIGSYSHYSQIVITVFMVIFGVDFSLYHLIGMKRIKTALKSSELRTYLGIIAVSIIIITFNCRDLFLSFGDSLRHAAFQVSSIITTTGYATTNFDKWPELSKTILIMLMFVGACAGSTGGGIKVSRLIILIKSIVKEIKISAHPKSTLKIQINNRAVEHETVRAINVFMVSYFVIFFLSVLLISIDNLDFTTNFTAVAATLNNVGPGFARVGPTHNFCDYSSFSKFVLTMDMLIGRLEIFPILVLLSPYTWKK